VKEKAEKKEEILTKRMRSSSMSDLKITIKNKTRPIECRKRLTRVLPRCQ
jgi:hypothetical protein